MSPKKNFDLSSEESRKKFRERFGQSRRRRGLTQEEVARQARVPTASISHFETGLRFPNAETLRRLADALGVSADYLLGRVEEPAGAGLAGTDPEFTALYRKFRDMTEEAREEVRQFLDTMAAKDKKGRGRDSKK